MYSTILTVQLQPGKTDEAMQILRDKIFPTLKDHQGFKSAHLVGDRNTDKLVYITFWETEADITAMDSSGTYQQSVAQFARLFAAPPVREKYGVLLQLE